MNKIKLFLSIITILCMYASLVTSALAIDVEGFYSIGYENKQNTKKNSSRLMQYLNLDLTNIGTSEISFHGYGKYRANIKKDRSDGDLYVAYIQYKSFQGATNIKLGRFDLVSNRFMTVDGAHITKITPWYFGVDAYAGAPRYKESEEKRDEFRYTGDFAFGGKVFLSGIDSVQFNINYYRESGKATKGNNKVYKETVGSGASYYKDLGTPDKPFNINTGLLIDQNIRNNNLERLSGRGSLKYGKFRFSINGDYFDVRDEYPEKRELIIRLLSTGRETRFGGTFYIDLNDNFNVYAGATFTEVKMRGNIDNTGEIYRVGAEMLFVKELGFSASFEGYRYDSHLETATGVTVAGDWQLTRDISLYMAYESAWLSGSSADKDTAYSIEAKISAYLTERLILSMYGQNGSKNNRFVDHYKWGGQLKYDF